MRILFWNTGRNKNINEYLLEMVEENDVDILIVAEYWSDEEKLDIILKNSKKRLIRWNTIGADRIKIWGNYCDAEPGVQEKYYSIHILNNEFIICGVHLFSNLHSERSDERIHLANEIMREIDVVKNEIKSDKVIIMGDINEAPYEKTCLSADGFHGMPELRVDDERSRKVLGKSYEKMYNPMWNLLGNFDYPPGTYYYSEAKLCTPAWYMLDQIIISRSMISLLKREDLRIIVECKGRKLYTKKRHPNKRISDHFPLICGFKI